MSTLYVLCLLLSPIPPENLPAYASEPEWAALKLLAFELEVCSPGVEGWRDNFALEVEWVWHRVREVQDCPRLVTGRHLDHAYCVACANFAALTYDRLEREAINSSNPGAWCSCLADQAKRRNAWAMARRASDPCSPATSRRQALYDLYYLCPDGVLPLHVSLGAFREVER